MQLTTLLLILAAMTVVSFAIGRARAIATTGDGSIRDLHSLPKYYGYFAAIWCGIPGILMIALWLAFGESVIVDRVLKELPAEMQAMPPAQTSLLVNDIKNIAAGQFVDPDRQFVDPDRKDDLTAAAALYVSLTNSGKWLVSGLATALAILGFGLAWMRVRPTLRARNHVERFIKIILILASTIAIFTTVGILLSVLFESIRFFQKVPATDFLFGLNWSPQISLRADQVGSSGSFGAIPLFVGTLLISGIALLVAVPIGLMIAIYLSEYANRRVRKSVKPVLEVLAGIPTVVYGYFAALTVAPMLRGVGESIGLGVASESALGAGLVMGVMIIPFVSSLSDDVINSVPQILRDGSLGLGATPSETIKKAVLPAALPGIVGSILLAASRAIGETMIVVMAAGLSAKLTINPLEAVTTVTVQIVTLLVGDQEFDSAKTLAAFALGLMLFVVTLLLNVVALRVVRKYREQYE